MAVKVLLALLKLNRDGWTGGEENNILFEHDGSTTRMAKIGSWVEGSGGRIALRFYTADDGVVSENMVIRGSGNVGIGTTTPIAKLNVKSGTDVEVARFEDESGNISVIDKDGNFGIGITTPAAKLNIYSDDNPSDTPLVNITNLDGNTPDSNALLVRGGANNNLGEVFEVQDYNGNTDFLVKGDGEVVIPNGNVGIGTTSPLHTLSIEGDYFGLGNATTTGSGYYGGDLRIIGTLDSSDQRFNNPITGEMIMSQTEDGEDLIWLNKNNEEVMRLTQDGWLSVRGIGTGDSKLEERIADLELKIEALENKQNWFMRFIEWIRRL